MDVAHYGRPEVMYESSIMETFVFFFTKFDDLVAKRLFFEEVSDIPMGVSLLGTVPMHAND